jgi:hypothetical protein
VAAELGDGFEDVDRLGGEFRADAVTGEDGNLELHAALPLTKAAEAFRSDLVPNR